MSSTEVENRPDVTKVTNVVKTCTGDSRHLVSKGEMRIKYETKVTCRGETETPLLSENWVVDLVELRRKTK